MVLAGNYINDWANFHFGLPQDLAIKCKLWIILEVIYIKEFNFKWGKKKNLWSCLIVFTFEFFVGIFLLSFHLPLPFSYHAHKEFETSNIIVLWLCNLCTWMRFQVYLVKHQQTNNFSYQTTVLCPTYWCIIVLVIRINWKAFHLVM